MLWRAKEVADGSHGLVPCSQGQLSVGADVFAIVHPRKVNLRGGSVGRAESERKGGR